MSALRQQRTFIEQSGLDPPYLQQGRCRGNPGKYWFHSVSVTGGWAVAQTWARLVGVGVPQACCSVVGTGDQGAAVRGERDCVDAVGVACEDGEGFGVSRVRHTPQRRGAVEAFDQDRSAGPRGLLVEGLQTRQLG